VEALSEGDVNLILQAKVATDAPYNLDEECTASEPKVRCDRMKIPAEPPIGHLVAYEYLWSSKARRREDGEKVYPTALILSKTVEFNSRLVYALSICCSPNPECEGSRSPPGHPDKRIDLPREGSFVTPAFWPKRRSGSGVGATCRVPPARRWRTASF